jgi:hypothetical protein
MSKMFFKYDSKRKADDLVQSLSLMFLTPASNIKAEDVWASAIRRKRKIEGLSITELLTYTVCGIKGVPSMTIVEFKKPFASDAKFIKSFKDNYLGTINTKISKSELVELANLQSKYEYSQYLEHWLQPNFPSLKESFTKAGLNEKDCKDLKKLHQTSVKPVNDWIKNRNAEIKKQIAPLTKFILCGF